LTVSCDPLLDWPTDPPPGYLGQLAAENQQELSVRRAAIKSDDCDWYHTVELPGGRVIEGSWDLRGNEHQYVGGVAVRSQEILELGPANGSMTFWLEAQGARVTSFEVGYDCFIELVPAVDGSDMKSAQDQLMRHTLRSNNAWWLQHRLRESTARIAYGDIYNLPSDLGRYDIAFLASILLHLREPYRALEQCARFAKMLIVTDILHSELDDPDRPVVLFANDQTNTGPSSRWWDLSPGAVSRMLWRLGFKRSLFSTHAQQYRMPGSGQGLASVPFFTIVASR
jgi:hypothetical protein